jgi:hypothetical protein
MNLYKITQNPENVSWDMYFGAVVIAENEEEARSIHPDRDFVWKDGYWVDKKSGKVDTFYAAKTWVKAPYDLNVELLGLCASGYSKPGVVLASFNGG